MLHASAIPASPETAPDLPDLDYPIFRDDTDRAVDLDPLGLDGFYSQAPVRRRHVRDVMTTLRLVTRRGHRHGVSDAATAVAMLRDIDPLMCRLQRIAMPSLPKRERGATSWGSGSFDPEMLERLLGHSQDGQTRLRAVTA